MYIANGIAILSCSFPSITQGNCGLITSEELRKIAHKERIASISFLHDLTIQKSRACCQRQRMNPSRKYHPMTWRERFSENWILISDTLLVTPKSTITAFCRNIV